MAIPLLLLALGGGLLLAATQKPPKRYGVEESDAKKIDQLVAWTQNCPLDEGLTPENAQEIRARMLAALGGFETPLELANFGQELYKRGFSRSASCVAAFASQLQQIRNDSILANQP